MLPARASVEENQTSVLDLKFGISKHSAVMTGLVNFRISQGLTQAQLAKALGLRSPGYLSVIERGVEPCPLKLAMQIEQLSSGTVPALSLVGPDDAKLLKAHRQFSAVQPAVSTDQVGGRA